MDVRPGAYIHVVKTISIGALRERVGGLIQRVLSPLRRAAFVRDVRQAEAEYALGAARHFDDVDDLLDAIRP